MRPIGDNAVSSANNPTLGFRVVSTQSHFGPGLLGPDDSAHFSIWDSSAQFSGTAQPIFCDLLFYIDYHLCASKQNMTLISDKEIEKLNEPHHEKICLRDFRLGHAQSGSSTILGTQRQYGR